MGFPRMVEKVPEGKVGAAEVCHFDITEDASRFTAFRPGEYVEPGRYAKLRVDGTLVMSDTRMEHRTNFAVVHEARGRVLIAGLGLGMILWPILDKRTVSSVTVLEKSPDVIRLVEPHTPRDKRLLVVHADVFTWGVKGRAPFDAIYFDIWSEQSTDTLKEMSTLHRRYRPLLAPEGWMDSWRRDELRWRRRQEREGERGRGLRW